MLVSKLIYYDEKNILPAAHQVKIIGLNFQLGLYTTWWMEWTPPNGHKLMIIFDMNVIL
jgi:hypothetical protein